MNVRIRRHRFPARTDLYGGVQRVVSDGEFLQLEAFGHALVCYRLREVAEILLDDEPGDWW